MATFESLPMDIKFLIFCSLPTVRSLKSLCQASASYNLAFLSHRSLIESTLFLQEALTLYPSEAIWLAHYHDRLRNSEIDNFTEELSLALLEYASYPDPPPSIKISDFGWRFGGEIESPERLFRSAIINEHLKLYDIPGSDGRRNYTGPNLPSEHKRKIVGYHRAIVDIYERFVSREIQKRAPAAPKQPKNRKVINAGPETYLWGSPEEEERIILALYRFFAGCDMVIFAPREVAWDFGNYILRIWGFWGTVGVRAVRDFLVQEIKQNQGLTMLTKYLYTQDPRFPLLYEFPENLPMWIDGRVEKEHLKKRARSIRHEIRTKKPYFYNLIDCKWHKLYFTPFYHFNAGYEPDYESGWAQGFKRNGEEVRVLKPNNSPSHKNPDVQMGKRPVDPNAGPVVIPFADGEDCLSAQKENVDIYAGLWDNKRLEGWGYDYCEWVLEDLGYSDYDSDCGQTPPEWIEYLIREEEDDTRLENLRHREWRKKEGKRGGKQKATMGKPGTNETRTGGNRSKSRSRPKKNEQVRVEDIAEYFLEMAVLDDTSKGEDV
ncbi:hypothetical protein TWF281_008731 [Arthrobotrys megalospora]